MKDVQLVRWIISGSFLLTAAIGIALSIPLWLGKIPPNRVTGFRVEATLADPVLWYKVNTALGLDMLILNFILLTTTVLLHFTISTKYPSYASLILVGIIILGYAAISLHGWYLTK